MQAISALQPFLAMLAGDYSDFQVNEPQIDLSPNLSPTRREALIFSPTLVGKGLGVRSHNCGLNT